MTIEDLENMDPGGIVGVVLCRPVDVSGLPSGIPIPDPHPGSVVSRCEGCEQEVWLGPEQDAYVKRETAKLYPDNPDAAVVVTNLCFVCGITLQKMAQARGQATPMHSLTDKTTPFRDPATGEVVEPESLNAYIAAHGDTGYAGFRIEEIWVATSIAADDQEAVVSFVDRTMTPPIQPLLASDRKRLDSFVVPMVENLRSQHPDQTFTIKHYKLVDEL